MFPGLFQIAIIRFGYPLNMSTVCFVAYAFVLATSAFKCTLSEQNAFRLTEPRHKTRRSTALIDALLQTARLRFSFNGFKIYTKPGSFSDAISDFQRLQPKDVDVVSKQSRYGAVGDRTISIQNIWGRPVLSIWKLEKHIGGSDELIMDKIEYL